MSRQNHTQTISQAQIKFLSDLAYQFLRMRPDSTDSSVHAGFIFPGENEEVVKLIMERWVQWKDRLLDDLPEHSPEYAKLFGSRGITFEEFKLITMPQIGEEVMKDQGRAFDYFYLIDKTAQIVFSSKVDNENKTAFENYFDLLLPFLTNEIPVLSAFFLQKKLPMYLPIKKGLDAHCYIPGRSGWGKSTLLNLLIFDLIRTSYRKKKSNWRRTVIVMEPNSDLVTTCLRYRFHYTQKERLIYLDPFIGSTCKKLLGEGKVDVKELLKEQEYTFVINPFDLKDRSDASVNYMVQELRNAFFLIIDEKATPQMKAVLNTCLYVLLKKPGSTIVDLMHFQQDDLNKELIEFGLSLPNPIHRDFLRTFSGNKKLQQSKSSIYYKLHSILSDDNFRRLMVGKTSTVDLEKEINRRGSIVLLNLSKGRMGAESAQAYGRLTMSYIFGLIRRRDEIPPRWRRETFMILDEFQNYIGNGETLDEVIAESRKLKLGMIFAQQVIGQKTPKETKDLIMGNTTMKIVGDLEPGSITEICRQIPELTPKRFSSLKRYTFFVHNAQRKEQGVLTLRTPSFLIDTSNTQFYMTDKQLAEVLSYLIHDSGLYIPRTDTPGVQSEGQEGDIPPLVEPGKILGAKETLFTPKFKKPHE